MKHDLSEKGFLAGPELYREFYKEAKSIRVGELFQFEFQRKIIKYFYWDAVERALGLGVGFLSTLYHSGYFDSEDQKYKFLKIFLYVFPDLGLEEDLL